MTQGAAAEALMILGALCTLAGVLTRELRHRKEPYKGRVMATVVEIVTGAPDRKGMEAGIHDYYYPVVAYYAEGRLIRKQFSKGGNPCPFRKNEQVALYYKEGEPELFKLADPGPLKKVERFFYSAGAGMCLLGVVSYMGFAARYLK